MKRKLFLAIGLMCTLGIMSVNAQELGVRFGNVTGGDVALDGVFSLGKFSRVHADVSFGDDIVGIDALWDFIYKPLGEEAFNWYVGAGPFLGLGNDFSLGAVGEVGIEYHFKGAPLALGIDWRPGFRLIDNTDFTADGFGFNLRYVFSSTKQ